MFDAALYLPFYYHLLLLITAVTAVVYMQDGSVGGIALGYNTTMSWVSVFLFVFIIGTRPVSGLHFVDMANYAMKFEAMAYGNGGEWADIGFDLLTRLCAQATGITGYFVVCAALYFVPVAVATKIVHGRWGFAALLAFAGGLSFFSYSVNGIRNGIATSLLVLAFATRERRIVMLLLMVTAISMHKSTILPAAAFIAAGFYSQPWAYAALWSIAFGASVILREKLSFFVNSFVSLGDDERLSGYVANAGLGEDKGGFRLDFVLYSIVPVILSYALSSANMRKDLFYRRLICTYLLANSAWLCLMFAAFSNRFAYLSWFMMPWIVIYPFIQKMDAPMAVERPRMGLLASGLIVHYLFTYIMVLYVYGRGI